MKRIEDMRLTEVAGDPMQRDAHCSIRHAGRTVNEHIQKFGSNASTCEKNWSAAHREDSDGRNRDTQARTSGCPKEAYPANSEKAACNKIRNNDYCTDQQRHYVRNAEYDENSFAQDTCRTRCGTGKHQNEHRCNNRNPASSWKRFLKNCGSVIASPAVWCTGADALQRAAS